jgi:hypothetical protein
MNNDGVCCANTFYINQTFAKQITKIINYSFLIFNSRRGNACFQSSNAKK